MNKIFVDCEMTGLTMQDQLISIGCVDEKTGKTFYAESTDFSIDKCNEWVQENVVNRLLFNDKEPFIKVNEDDGNITMKCNNGDIAHILEEWLKLYNTKCIMVADVGHYDMCHIYEIFGGAFNTPECLSPTYIELNMLIAYTLNVSEHEAFDINRESLIDSGDLGQKHNALYDAKVAKEIYKKYSK